MSLRNERVRKTLMKEISDIILREIKDPNLSGVVSITDVEVSSDNSSARVYFSVFGDENAKKATAKALENNVSKIRHEVGKRIRLRHTPALHFVEDNSLERGAKVTELLNKISRGEI
ncbi:ribosome-binding factor A [Candidatus Gastranaerophilus sp. (ex Termes propinquus)]|nr:ribosome-binding factor A [Candidatus Gastranaerophilus sp. (ex Termes propinquus)]